MTDYQPGIRHNLGQFGQQLLQVFFVGLTIGMQRTVVPVLAESEFGVPAGSAALLVHGFVAWSFTAALTGIGMALLYPTLIAAVGDISHPDWRGSSLGVYRFWRALGYGIGALLLGLLVDAFGAYEAAFWLTAVVMALSGLWVAIAMDETLATRNPAIER